jgi:hypothetical protein
MNGDVYERSPHVAQRELVFRSRPCDLSTRVRRDLPKPRHRVSDSDLNKDESGITAHLEVRERQLRRDKRDERYAAPNLEE